jgi:hypothetical protein
MTINPNLTLIPDGAEVWFALKSAVTNISTFTPATPTDDLAALGWEDVGLIDDGKGISLEPSGEVREYDAFGHPAFRVKFRKGKLKSGFTAFEWNSVTRKFVLPGSTPSHIGIPRDIQGYLAYKYVDEDRTTVWVQLSPALIELQNMGPIADGELSFADIKVHHTANAARDAFKVIDSSSDDVVKTFTIAGGVTTYTVTVDAATSSSIATKTAAALQSALQALAPVVALPSPGATVTGPSGGPLVATFTGPVGTVSATGTGGTVTVS